MSAAHEKRHRASGREPIIRNRKARHTYVIGDTLECGIKLTGTEVKSVRAGQVSLGEGYARAGEAPLSLVLMGIHIAHFPDAGEHQQHDPVQSRILLAHRREIRKLAAKTRQRGATLVPLKMYFVNGRVKVLIGVAHGKRQADQRQALQAKEAQRDMDRALQKRRG